MACILMFKSFLYTECHDISQFARFVFLATYQQVMSKIQALTCLSDGFWAITELRASLNLWMTLWNCEMLNGCWIYSPFAMEIAHFPHLDGKCLASLQLELETIRRSEMISRLFQTIPCFPINRWTYLFINILNWMVVIVGDLREFRESNRKLFFAEIWSTANQRTHFHYDINMIYRKMYGAFLCIFIMKVFVIFTFIQSTDEIYSSKQSDNLTGEKYLQEKKGLNWNGMLFLETYYIYRFSTTELSTAAIKFMLVVEFCIAFD